MKLSQLKQGERATVEEIALKAEERARLSALGVVCGRELILRKRLKRAVLFGVNGTNVSVSEQIANAITVQKCGGNRESEK